MVPRQQRISVHEAGHAIAACMFGLGFENAELRGGSGCVTVRLPGGEFLNDLSFEDAVRYMIVKYAGVCAEYRLENRATMPDPNNLRGGHGGVNDFLEAYASARIVFEKNPIGFCHCVMEIAWKWMQKPEVWARVCALAGVLLDDQAVTEAHPVVHGIKRYQAPRIFEKLRVACATA